MKEAKFCSAEHGYYDDNIRRGCPKCEQEQRLADEIAVVKADIRRLKTRLNYLKHLGPGPLNQLIQEGMEDCIAVLQKYLAKIKRTK